MTFEEAKKLLKKEFTVILFRKAAEPFEFDESRWFENEKPSVLEAFRVLAKEGYYTAISGHDYMEHEKRLNEEHKKNIKAPGPDEEQPEEKRRIICCSASPKADFYYKHVLNEGNPALKEAASQFNDALLDEQAKKIAEQNKEITRLLSLVEKKENSISRLYYEKSVLEKENEELKKGEIPARYFDKALVDEQEEKIKKLEHEKLDILEIAGSCKRISAEQAKEIKCIKEKNLRLGREIARLNKNIYKKNLKIEELRKESSRHLRGKIKMFGENVDLEQMLKDKNAVLSDVAEELRLSKIREKNLTEVSQKYMKENEELKEKLKSINMNRHNERICKKQLAEKDEVIANLGKELEAKHKEYVWYKGAYDGAQQILNTIADYAAKHPDKKFSDQMVQDAHEECGTKVLVDKSVFEQIMKKAYGK